MGQDPGKLAPTSKLFDDKHLYFYFEPSIQYKLKGCMRDLVNNSGKMLRNLTCVIDKSVSVSKLFCVIPDGQPNLTSKVQSEIGKDIPVFVSSRWVQYCIERNTVIKNPMELKLYHLLPFTHETPYPDMSDVHIYINPKIEFNNRAMLTGCITTMGASVTMHSTEEYSYSYTATISRSSCSWTIHLPRLTLEMQTRYASQS